MREIPMKDQREALHMKRCLETAIDFWQHLYRTAEEHPDGWIIQMDNVKAKAFFEEQFPDVFITEMQIELLGRDLKNILEEEEGLTSCGCWEFAHGLNHLFESPSSN